jgi:hypothetical protein
LVTTLPRYKKDSTCSISFPFIDKVCSISELILISLVLLTFIYIYRHCLSNRHLITLNVN